MKLLLTILGIKKDISAIIISEIGVEIWVIFYFPTFSILVVSPGTHENAGKRKRTRTPNGIPHLKSAMYEAVLAVSRCRSRWLATENWAIQEEERKKHPLLYRIECFE
ncbi:transposase [Neobacillus sp. PS3-40]|uniref:transposase n=1 Tax=Neobacillus sp. PS3-40 TaxID=3070679 RepID=UPI0027DEDA51|nr:transposase [Neobacillus sp. PS3-40]WML46159.1 transposase [Neobacillus sp. PS3-40]